MKNSMVFCFLTSSIIFTQSCSSTPQEAKNDISNYNDDSVYSDDFEFSYINVDEIGSNAEKALNKDYMQFNIDDNFTVESPSELNIMSFKTVVNFDTNYMKVFGLFLSLVKFIYKK